MPILKNRTTLEIARGIKAFLSLDAGLTRGAAPHPEQRLEQAQRQLRKKDRRIEQMRERLTSREREVPGPLGASGSGKGGNEHTEEGAYEALYEAHARAHTAEDAVGGSFDLVGRLELEVLLKEGLKPSDTLVDLGCGTGRLAVHTIPVLEGGRYIGIDISQTMLDEARKLVREALPGSAETLKQRVSWIKQTTSVFPLDADSVDMICAFSVFTHMEHEDTYRYLKDALRVVRPGGTFVLSCLPLDLALARVVFLESAGVDLQTRWSQVRNVTTSKEMMTEIARMAEWSPVRWYDGEERNVVLPDTGESHALGQSVCVLKAPSESGTGSA